MKFLHGEVKKEKGQMLSHKQKLFDLFPLRHCTVTLEPSACTAPNTNAAFPYVLNGWSRYQYGMWLLEDKLPDGSAVSKGDYLKMMTSAADQDHVKAQSKLARYYSDEEDHERALEYGRLAAQQGDKELLKLTQTSLRP